MTEEYKIDFFDGYYVVVDATVNLNVFQFYTPDGKRAKEFKLKDEPRGMGSTTAFSKEIKKHLEPEGPRKTKTMIEDDFEEIMIELSDMIEEIIVAKNEADELVKEMEESCIEDEIEEGLQKLNEVKMPLVWIANKVDWKTAGERFNIMYAFIAYCSQIILRQPISVIALGEGGSGKTHIEEVAMSMIPQDYVMHIKSTTEAALFGFCDDNPYQFDGKVIDIGDMGGKDDHKESQDFKNAMKELQSDGHMTRIKQVPNPEGGYTNQTYELFGYPCITYTSVTGHTFDDQEMSRSVILTPLKKNKRAFTIFRQLNKEKGTPNEARIKENTEDLPEIPKMVRALRSRNLNIINPYGSFIERFLGTSSFYYRDFDKYDGILRTIAAINGYNRKIYDIGGQQTLFVNKYDIRIFVNLLQRYHTAINKNISKGAEEVYEKLLEHADEWDLYECISEDLPGISVNEFDARGVLPYAKQTVGKYFGELNSKGLITTLDYRGKSNRYGLQASSDLNKDFSNITMSEEEEKMFRYSYGEIADEVLEDEKQYDNYPLLDHVIDPDNEPYWNKFIVERP